MLASFVYTVPFEPLMGNAAARYEPAKFTWIGNMEEGVAVCGVSKAAGIARFEDMRTKEVLIGGASSNGALARSALAVRNLFGVKMKVVSGYKGTASIKIAIGRGEVHGVCSVLMSTITSVWREDYESGNFRPIIQLSGRARVGADIPHVDDYVKSDDDRQVHALIFGVAGARQALRRAARHSGRSPRRAARGAARHHERRGIRRRSGQDAARHFADDGAGGRGLHRPGVDGVARGDRAREAGLRPVKHH